MLGMVGDRAWVWAPRLPAVRSWFMRLLQWVGPLLAERPCRVVSGDERIGLPLTAAVKLLRMSVGSSGAGREREEKEEEEEEEAGW